MDKTIKKIYYWIDHTSKFPTNTGMQRVTRSLARILLDIGVELEFVCWDEKQRCFVIPTREEVIIISSWNGPQLDPNNYSNEHVIISKDHLKNNWLLVPEVTYITYHSVPQTDLFLNYAKTSGLKTAFIFYDAVPLKLAEYSEFKESHTEYMRWLQYADLILPISYFSSNDIYNFFKNLNSAEKIPIIEPCSLPGEILSVNRVVDISEPPKSKPFLILSIGSIEKRKNQQNLLKAFIEVTKLTKRVDLELVFVGNLEPEYGDVILQATQKYENIKWLGYISDDEVKQLYLDCQFTVFPSTEEGFGLPILESLWHGKPCICANFGAMEEVANNSGCLMVDVTDTAALVDAINTLVSNDELRHKLADEAVSRKIKTWLEYGNDVLNCLEKVEHQRVCFYYYVNHTCDYPKNTGIQRVTRSLARSIQENNYDIKFVKWEPSTSSFIKLDESELIHLANWNGPKLDTNKDLQEHNYVSRWLIIPELVSDPSLPLQNIINSAHNFNMKTAVVFYDTIPVKLQQFYPPEATAAHEKYMLALHNADIVFPISETSGNDLKLFWYSQLSRINQVENKIKVCMLPGEFPELSRKHDYLIRQEETISILSVGTIEPRKNHLKLIEAFMLAKQNSERSLFLTIVGGTYPGYSDQFEKMIDGHSDIRWIQSADDKTLQELYDECDFTVYPSLDEGFGLPILESIWNGKPCICRNIGAMAEVGEGGGCLLTDTAIVEDLAKSIEQLANSNSLRKQLSQEAVTRKIKTWREYGQNVIDSCIQYDINHLDYNIVPLNVTTQQKYYAPLLSICVSTYNRANRLRASLHWILKYATLYQDVIEVIVCDNASHDHTEDVVKEFSNYKNLHYYRNTQNVGMLGNLKVTAHHAKGNYVWILGDDDLMLEGAIENILLAILENPNVPLIYLNYAYTHTDLMGDVEQAKQVIDAAIPISQPGHNYMYQHIRDLSMNTENCFTAIYTLVFRKDHAIGAYSQNITGKPFSTLLTCVPTSYYVCKYMFDEPGYWIGEPAVVANLNVSWMKYASLFILERFPEVHDLMENMGVNRNKVDLIREKHFPHMLQFIFQIYTDAEKDNREHFSIERLIERYKHLSIFKANWTTIRDIYHNAYEKGVVDANIMEANALFEKYDFINKT